jgi:hypothetical protein
MQAFEALPVSHDPVDHPQRFYRVQHSDSHTHHRDANYSFEARGRLRLASRSGMPHFLYEIYLRRQLSAPDYAVGPEAASRWGGRESPYISVFAKKGEQLLRLVVHKLD